MVVMDSGPTPYGVSRNDDGDEAAAVSSDLPDVSIPRFKNISVFQKRKSAVWSAHPAPPEGRFAIVTSAGAGCDGRKSAVDERSSCGRRSRVVPMPRRWHQPPGQEPGGTEAIKPGTP